MKFIKTQSGHLNKTGYKPEMRQGCIFILSLPGSSQEFVNFPTKLLDLGTESISCCFRFPNCYVYLWDWTDYFLIGSSHFDQWYRVTVHYNVTVWWNILFHKSNQHADYRHSQWKHCLGFIYHKPWKHKFLNTFSWKTIMFHYPSPFLDFELTSENQDSCLNSPSYWDVRMSTLNYSTLEL